MINKIGFIPTTEEYLSKPDIAYCRNCGIVWSFEESDIDRTKLLPHIACSCGNNIQLHSKYYKKTK